MEIYTTVQQKVFIVMVEKWCSPIGCHQKEYRKQYDEGIRGRALMDVDMTPSYLHARYAGGLLNEVSEAPNQATNISVCSFIWSHLQTETYIGLWY